MRFHAAVVLAACVAAAPAANASIFIAKDAARPQLAVDARGYAQITWVERGARQIVIVPPKGQLTHGGSLSGADVSRPVSGVRLPLKAIVRRGPGGLLFALQQWQVQPNGPIELHLARWSGPIPELRLALEGQRLTGSVSLGGRPVTGFTSTLEGKRLRIYVGLECFGCPAARGGWSRMLGVAPKSNGTFAVLLRPAWLGKRYRATVAGPNAGTTYAPDAQIEIPAR
jgi:hypothetical protein